MTFRDIGNEDIERALIARGANKRFIDRQDFDSVLKSLSSDIVYADTMDLSEEVIGPGFADAILAQATKNLDLTNPAVAAQLTCARNSVGYSRNSAGVYSSFAINVPRITDLGLLVEEGRTNSIRNNSMQGAVAGTPGTLPTNWSWGGTATKEIVGVGTENGIDYIDVRISGSGGGAYEISFDTGSIPASNGQSWTGSVFHKTIAGSFAGVTLRWVVYELGGVLSAVNPLVVDTPVLSRASMTKTNTSVGTTTEAFRLNITPGAGAYDVTLRIGWPQLELGAFVTSPIRTTTATVARLADVVSVPLAMTGPLTVFSDHTIPAGVASGAKVVWELDNGTNNERRLLRCENTNGNLDVFNVAAGVATYSDVLAVAVNGTAYKTAIRTNIDNFRGAVNGALKIADVSGALPAVSTILRIGSELGVNYLNGYLRWLAYWLTPVPDHDLVTLTGD